MQKIKFRIITESGVWHESEADIAVLPGSEGEFGVMYAHVPMIVQLKVGNIRLENGREAVKAFHIKSPAVARVESGGVDVLLSSSCVSG